MSHKLRILKCCSYWKDLLCYFFPLKTSFQQLWLILIVLHYLDCQLSVFVLPCAFCKREDKCIWYILKSPFTGDAFWSAMNNIVYQGKIWPSLFAFIHHIHKNLFMVPETSLIMSFSMLIQSENYADCLYFLTARIVWWHESAISDAHGGVATNCAECN